MQVRISGLPAEPWPRVETGERIQIRGGPLSGVDGVLLRRKNDTRLIVSVTLLSRSVAVDVDPRWLLRA